MRAQYALQQQSSEITHEQSEAFQQTVAVAQDLRDKIANFDDFFRPLRNYFYWEPHCFDIPVCFALRSLFDALDGNDTLNLDFVNGSPLPTPADPNSIVYLDGNGTDTLNVLGTAGDDTFTLNVTAAPTFAVTATAPAITTPAIPVAGEVLSM